MRKNKLLALLAIAFSGVALASCNKGAKDLSSDTKVEEKKETPTEEKKETPTEEKKDDTKKETPVVEEKKTLTQTINYSSLGFEKTANSYTDFTFTQDEVQFGGRAVPNGKTIQFNTKESNKKTYAGISNLTTVGTIKSIKVTFNNNGKGKSQYNNKFNVFASKDTAFTDYEKICFDDKASHVTQFEFDNTQFEYEYSFEEGTSYFALASDGYAFYLDSIEIVWNLK